jgi:hypothetical protein
VIRDGDVSTGRLPVCAGADGVGAACDSGVGVVKGSIFRPLTGLTGADDMMAAGLGGASHLG